MTISQSESSIGGVRREAIIIGISEYQNLAKLEGADKNARDFQERLKTSNSKLNFNINMDKHCLFNSDATCANIRQCISDVLWNSEPGDIIILYFSGYGFVDKY